MNAERNSGALLIGAAIIAAPRFRELKDSPALRALISDSIRVARFMALILDRYYPDNKHNVPPKANGLK